MRIGRNLAPSNPTPYQHGIILQISRKMLWPLLLLKYELLYNIYCNLKKKSSRIVLCLHIVPAVSLFWKASQINFGTPCAVLCGLPALPLCAPRGPFKNDNLHINVIVYLYAHYQFWRVLTSENAQG